MSYTDTTLLKGSEARLWALIEERGRAGVDTADIDQRIWDLFGEDWAVMFTDLAGFSRQVAAFGIIHFLEIIHRQKQLLLPIVGSYDGILIKIEADSLLCLFKRPKRALECAVAMQHACDDYNQTRLPEAHLLLCVGIGYGRILRIGDIDVFGQEVNASSKLGEDTARAHEILVTRALRDAVGEGPGLSFSELAVTVPGSAENFRVHYR